MSGQFGRVQTGPRSGFVGIGGFRFLYAEA